MFFNDTATTEIYTYLHTLALHDALPISAWSADAPKTVADPALALLQKIQQAARKLDYAGVYTYQQGALMVSSRIVHMVDGTGERERIEMLDGAPREYLRHNEVTQCLMPEKKAVIIERRRGNRLPRSAERRVGKESVGTCRSRVW